MAKYADWYTVELDGYLKGRVSDVHRFHAVREISNHIAEHVDELIERGMDSVDAEKAAIASFGPPRNAALNFLQGRNPWTKLGNILLWVGCIGIVATICFTGIFFQNMMLYRPWSEYGSYFLPISAGLWVAMGIGLAFGALMTKKVAVKRLFSSWMVGLMLTAGYLLAGPEKHFADVVPTQFETAMKGWQEGHTATLKIAKLYDSIAEPSGIQDVNGQNVAQDRTLAIERIRTLGPQLLAIKPSYVSVRGKETTGFLGPVDNGYYPYHQYAQARYGADPYRIGMDELPVTGHAFPWTRLNLQYFKTADEAIEAWSSSSRYFGGQTNEFSQMAVHQELFMGNAKEIVEMSRAQVAFRTLGPLAGGTLGMLLLVLIVSWLLTKIPNVTLHSSFRRKIA